MDLVLGPPAAAPHDSHVGELVKTLILRVIRMNELAVNADKNPLEAMEETSFRFFPNPETLGSPLG